MSLTIFTAANRAYEPFVLPYAGSCLFFNDDAVVEIALEDPENFLNENREALEIIKQYYGDRFQVRSGNFTKRKANSVRFLETPINKSEYVYIGDIDILIVEPITDVHIENMKRTGLPYSNIKRPGRTGLSGLHFTPWDNYYPHAETASSRINRDEGYLYDLIVARGLPIPSEDEKFRPAHGFHLSLNRDPRSRSMTWGGTTSRVYIDAYVKMRKSEFWESLSAQFDERYLLLLFVLEVKMNLGSTNEIGDFDPQTNVLKRLWETLSK